jgi:type II secretory pathway predicted ATPase ExeA
MFLDFYKLRVQPFGVTPDPRFLYFSPGHREALASLFYGIETGRGFLSLVAEPGMGKTTLFFQLLQRWKGYIHSAFLFQTQCNSRELVRYLLDDLGLKSDGEDIVRMHSELNEFLFRETKAGRRVVVFIDEAQNLSDSVLETVRLLSDFEAPDKKLLQIILAGQPELGHRLSRPGLAQLRQRIAIQAQLNPLSPEEVARYVQHRLKVAGYEGPELFSPAALRLIADASRGIPRLINNLCFNALSLGRAKRLRQIDSRLVTEAASDMPVDVRIPKLSLLREQLTPHSPHSPHSNEGRQAPRPSFFSRIKESLLRRRMFQTSIILLLLGGVAIYLGAPSKSGTLARPEGVGNQVFISAEAAAPVVPVAPTEATPAEGAPTQAPAQTVRTALPVRTFTYVVQPKDTLSRLCRAVLGRYDRTVLSKVWELNPDLKSPDKLELGQEIRLPLSIANDWNGAGDERKF